MVGEEDWGRKTMMIGNFWGEEEDGEEFCVYGFILWSANFWQLGYL